MDGRPERRSPLVRILTISIPTFVNSDEGSPHAPTLCLRAAVVACRFATVSSSDAIALSIRRSSSESPNDRAYSRASSLIWQTTLLTTNFPGLPRSARPTRLFVSSPASRALRTATPRSPKRFLTSRRKSWITLSSSSSFSAAVPGRLPREPLEVVGDDLGDVESGVG